ncbi:MAG: hypothetical protein RIA69_14195 [Cyclobacteriaceae bacterium]
MLFQIILFTTIFFPLSQSEYLLSQGTKDEFDVLLSQHQIYSIIIKAIPAFSVFDENNLQSNTISAYFSEETWEELSESIEGLSKTTHARIAEHCKRNMNSTQVSQTSSDRKFWQILYTIHFRQSRK